MFLVYGNDVSGSSGLIASPLYPRTYPTNADYRWTITVSGDSYIEIRFLDIDIEDLSACYYDQLKVCARIEIWESDIKVLHLGEHFYKYVFHWIKWMKAEQGCFK